MKGFPLICRSRSFAMGTLAVICSLPIAALIDTPAEINARAEAILKSPEFSGIQLSPEGSHLAMFHLDGDRHTIATYDLQRGRGYVLEPGTTDVSSFGWIDDSTLIFSRSRWKVFYEGLYAANSNLRRAQRLDGSDRNEQRIMGLFQSLPMVRGQAVVADYSTRPFSTLYRYRHANRGSFHQIANRDEFILNLAFDLGGTFRVKQIGSDQPNESTILHRPTEQDPWVVLKIPSRSVDQLLGFAPGGEILYLTYKNAEGRTVLQGYDVIEESFVGGAISDPHYAINPSMILLPSTGEAIGYIYQADYPVIQYFASEMAQASQALAQAVPGMAHLFIGHRANGSLLFHSWSDRQPSIIHEVNFAKGQIGRVIESRPAIETDVLARMMPFSFPARDGVRIRGYLTLPPGADPSTTGALPAVALVHGGPKARDYWGFDPEVQFLASMGLAVIQINYRGSSDLYEKMGNLTFLDACKYGVDDVADGVRWLIDQGIVDDKRVAIYGWSFGGYAAIASVARYPDLYQAAFAAAGVYDFNALWDVREENYSTYLNWNHDYLGDLTNSRDAYASVSPVNEVDSIRVPVFLLHGEADRVVPASQSRALHRALRNAGKASTLQTPSWLQHGYGMESQRIRYTRTVYEFLLEHIKE